MTNVNFEEPVRYPSFIKILNTYNFLIFKVGSSWLRISSFLITLKYFKKMTRRPGAKTSGINFVSPFFI